MTKVTLEPELQAIAAIWPAAKRFEVAHKLGRWSHQLKVSARIMIKNASPSPRPRVLPRIARRKARLN
jgi:hypothetical protein